jgi:GWxTD domain-containing protein
LLKKLLPVLLLTLLASATLTAQSGEDKSLSHLPDQYRFWLTEDAAYIISPPERSMFLRLGSDEERDQFIEQFWYRRASDPRSFVNDFEQEHYRRIVLANEKFSAGVPGWKTDRGRIYILFGPPDEVDSHPIADPEWRPPKDVSDDAKYSWESWHYRHIEGIGENVGLEFVDPAGSGNYSLRTQLSDKTIADLNSRRSMGHLPGERVNLDAPRQFFVYIGVQPTPVIKHKDLEALVTSRIIRDQVHFSYRVDYTPATHASIIARIVVEIPEDQLSLPAHNENSSAGFEFFGRISKPTGRVVSTFEDSRNLDQQLASAQHKSIQETETTAILEPETYRLALVVKDVINGRVGVLNAKLQVPNYNELVLQNQTR